MHPLRKLMHSEFPTQLICGS